MTDRTDSTKRPWWITRYDRAAERKFLFYATLVMLIIWAGFKLFGT